MRARVEDHGLVVKERVREDAPVGAKLLQRRSHRFKHGLRDKVQ